MSESTILTLVRHGETTANVEGVWHGSIDTQLTDRGLRQAERVARHLASTRPQAAAVYASPLIRSLLTARAIADALGLEARIEPDLTEYHLGSLEGVSYRELTAKHRLFDCMREDPDHCPGGGESPRQVAERYAGVLRRIGAAHPGENPIVVGHGGAFTLGLGLLVDGDVTSWRSVMGNCAVSDLVMDPRPALLSFNHTDHLEDL
jgi:probable phosphoglycerate mutase